MLPSHIVKLIDKTGSTVVEYTYDTWGKPLSATGSLAETFGTEQPFRYRGYVYDEETGFYYLQSRYYDPEVGRFISAGVYLSTGQGVLGHNSYAYCMNSPVNMIDFSGHWPKWLETAVKVMSVVVAVAAVVTTVVAVSAFTAGTGSAAAVYGATILLGAALSGINGGVANETKGNSYTNGYVGGATGGAIQSACSRTIGGTIIGGGVGVTVGTLVMDVMNNWDPDSSDSTAKEIATNAAASGVKALATSSLTAYIGYASNIAVVDGAGGLIPTYTFGFGEGLKAFFGWLDDALVYIWE